MQSLHLLSDRELDQATRHKAKQEQETTLDLLLHLKEIEARRVYSLLAFSSLWEYCVKGLGYGEGAASERVAAMRLLKQNPETEEKLRAGTLNLGTAAQLHRFFQNETKEGRNLEPAQQNTLIEQAAGQSKREVEKLLLTESFKQRGYGAENSIDNANLFQTANETPPNSPNIAGSYHPVTTTVTGTTSSNTVATRHFGSNLHNDVSSPTTPSSPAIPKPFKEKTRLVTPDLTELKIYADAELMALLTRIQELRGPRQSHADLFKAAIQFYLVKKDPLRKVVKKKKAENKTKTTPIKPAITSVSSNSCKANTAGNLAQKLPSNASERVKSNTIQPTSSPSITNTPNNCSRSRHLHTTMPSTAEDLAMLTDPSQSNSNTKTSAAERAPSTPTTRSRYIPAATRQALFVRSNGQCEYMDPQTQQRCRCKTQLEIEHTRPFALGGTHSFSNLKIYCAPHNQLAAIQVYGEKKMESYCQQ